MRMPLIIFSALLILLIGKILTKISYQFGAKPTGASYDKITNSTNYKDGKFKNNEDASADFHLKTIFEFFTNPNTKPKSMLPTERVNLSLYQSQEDINTKITWLGHSTLLLEVNNKTIFLDPMLSSVPSPHPKIGFKRFNAELPIDTEDIPNIDAVLISHDHYDHLDYSSIIKLKDKTKLFYVPLGVGAHLKAWGVDDSKIIELDWWDKSTNEDLDFICTPAHHFSGRGVSNRNSTLWSSWIIKSNNTKIFFSGDSGYSNHFKEIGERFGPFNLTLMECGQYNTDWADIHMMPEETVQAHIDLKGELLLPIHWGAFQLSTHPWNESVERLLKKTDSLDVQVATPMIGETFILEDEVPNSKWWHISEQ